MGDWEVLWDCGRVGDTVIPEAWNNAAACAAQGLVQNTEIGKIIVGTNLQYHPDRPVTERYYRDRCGVVTLKGSNGAGTARYFDRAISYHRWRLGEINGLPNPNTPPAEVPQWQPGTAPTPAYVAPPVEVPPWVPWLDPDQLPIGQPVPVPVPIPYPLLPELRPDPTPHRVRRRTPRYRDIDQPSVDVEVTPGGSTRPNPTPRPGTHTRRPPGRGERERKQNIKYGTVTRFMGKIIGGYTEADDFIDAMYKGVPWEKRRWRGSDGKWRDRDFGPLAKAKRIYDEIENYDIEAGLKAVIKDQVEDYLYGRFGQIGNKAAAGNPYYVGAQGLQSGDRYRRASDRLLQEQIGDGQPRKEKPLIPWRKSA